METAHLFVYGTLRPAASDPLGRRARARLAAESEAVGTACVTGRLYDLGRYPGLWIGPGPAVPVAGEVLRLASPRMTFAWLDQYEGGEYARQRRLVDLSGGGMLLCWLYALRRPPAARPVASGDWLAALSPAGAAATPRASSGRRQFRRSRM